MDVRIEQKGDLVYLTYTIGVSFGEVIPPLSRDECIRLHETALTRCKVGSKNWKHHKKTLWKYETGRL